MGEMITMTDNLSDAAARWRLLCLVTLGTFLALGFAVFAIGLLPGDMAVHQEVRNSKTAAMIQFARWVNYGGSWPVVLPATVLLFVLFRAARRHWWLWCGVLVASGATEHFVKVLVGRPRPAGHAFGFPSGHATASSAFAVILIYLVTRERLGGVPLVLIRSAAVTSIILVSWARIVLHAHWLSDVLGGVLLGTTYAAAGAWWETAREGGAAETGPGRHA